MKHCYYNGIIMGQTIYQLVQKFFHPRYASLVVKNEPLSNFLGRVVLSRGWSSIPWGVIFLIAMGMDLHIFPLWDG